MANSRYFLVILGKSAFDQSFRDGKGKIDVFYNEILYAKEKCFKEDRENRIFVCCLEKFDCKSIPDSNSNEDDKKKIRMIKEIADRYQRIGAKGNDIWEYEAFPRLEADIEQLLRKNRFF